MGAFTWLSQVVSLGGDADKKEFLCCSAFQWGTMEGLEFSVACHNLTMSVYDCIMFFAVHVRLKVKDDIIHVRVMWIMETSKSVIKLLLLAPLPPPLDIPPPPPQLPTPILCPSPSSSTHSVTVLTHWLSHTWQSLTLPLPLALLHILSISCRNTNKMSLLALLRLHLLLATCRLTSPFSSLVITCTLLLPPSPSPPPPLHSIHAALEFFMRSCPFVHHKQIPPPPSCLSMPQQFKLSLSFILLSKHHVTQHALKLKVSEFLMCWSWTECGRRRVWGHSNICTKLQARHSILQW